MIRVLQCVNNMHRAGLETMLMNYYRNIDRTQIQFDFLTHRPDRSDYDDEIESMGGRVFYAPRLYPQNYPAYFSYMRSFFYEHPEYRIVHSHIDAMSYLPLLAAKKAGVPIRIAHSHNTSINKDFKYPLKQYFRFCIPSVASHCFSCGDAAGKFLFGNRNFKIIPNAVDADKFVFDPYLRSIKRKELGLENKFVIGNVGRFEKEKNHKFLISLLPGLLKKENNAVLLLVGEGSRFNEIKRLADQCGLKEKVCFLGNRSDVNELYQVMDVFVLPSLFEGIPLVGIEAQFSGLPCIFSDKVPKDVGIARDSAFIPLSEDIWIDEMLRAKEKNREISKIDNAMYDIKHAYPVLEDEYKLLYYRAKNV